MIDLMLSDAKIYFLTRIKLKEKKQKYIFVPKPLTFVPKSDILIM